MRIRFFYLLFSFLISTVAFADDSRELLHFPIVINGQNHELEIALNEALQILSIDDDSGLAPPSGEFERGYHYKGRIVGADDSWVRMSQIHGQWQGLILLGSSQYSVEQLPLSSSLQEFSAHPVVALPGDDTPPSFAMPVTNLFPPRTDNYPESVQYSDLCNEGTLIDGVCLMAKLEVVFDQAFSQRFANRYQANALAIINMVEGFYLHDFHIAFDSRTVAFAGPGLFSAGVIDTDGDIDSDRALSDLLTQRTSGDISYLKDDYSFFHVITGRNLTDVGGKAYSTFTCTEQSIAITQYHQNNEYTAVVVTHELGHNMGAAHDGVNGICETYGNIMAPTAPSRAPGFSECSKNQIRSRLSNLGPLFIKPQGIYNCFTMPVDLGLKASDENPQTASQGQDVSLKYDVSVQAGLITREHAYKLQATMVVAGTVEASQGVISRVVYQSPDSEQECDIKEDGSAYQCHIYAPHHSATLDVTAQVSDLQQFNLYQHVRFSEESSNFIEKRPDDNELTTSLGIHGTVEKPQVPTYLTGDFTGEHIALNWSDNSDNESGFRIERKVGKLGEGLFDVIAEVGSDQESYKDSDVEPGETYHYRLAAFNDYGAAWVDEPLSVTIDPLPAAASDLEIFHSEGFYYLQWKDRSHNEQGFRIERSVNGGAWQVLSTTNENVAFYFESVALADHNYRFRVIAFNNIGDAPASNVAELLLNPDAVEEQRPPVAPSDFSAELVTTGIQLHWQDNSDNENTFLLLRSEGAGSTPQSYDSVGSDSTQYEDTQIAPGTVYRYQIVAINEFGESEPSQIVEVMAPAPELSVTLDGSLPLQVGQQVTIRMAMNTPHAYQYRVQVRGKERKSTLQKWSENSAVVWDTTDFTGNNKIQVQARRVDDRSIRYKTTLKKIKVQTGN